MIFRVLLLTILTVAPSAAVHAQITNRQTRTRESKLIYYRYKGVDLPLKSYVEIHGNRPLLKIIDGRNEIWVSELKDRRQVLDRILDAELDAMTGAGDNLLRRGRYQAAFAAFEQIHDVVTVHRPDDLENFPAIRAYLLLRMGQCRSWLVSEAFRDAQRNFDLAQRQLAAADEIRAHRTQGFMATSHEAQAALHTTTAQHFLEQAATHRQQATKLLTRANTAHRAAAHGNQELYQAHNELGILSFWAGQDALAAGDTATAKTNYEKAVSHFKSARSASRGQEFLADNLVVSYNGLADIAHSKGNISEAQRLIQKAMAILPPPPPRDPDAKGTTGATDSFLMSFRNYHTWRQEEIVILAPVEAGLVAKYLSLERDKHDWPRAVEHARKAGANPTWTLWTEVGREYLKAGDWSSAAALYEGLHTAYLGQNPTEASTGTPPEKFTRHVNDALLVSFRKLGEALYTAKRYDDAVALYARAQRYLPASEVLSSGLVTATIDLVDGSLADGLWEDALVKLETLQEIFNADPGDSDTAEKARIRNLWDTRVAAAHLGLSSRDLAAGNLDSAAEHAERALELAPDRRDFQEAKARVLATYARTAEAAGPNQWGAAHKYYLQAIEAGPFLPRLRLAAGSLAVRMRVRSAQVGAVKYLSDYGRFILVFFLGLVVVVPLGRTAWTEQSRRRRVRVLRSQGTRAYNEKRWHDAVASLNDYRRLARTGIPAEVLEILARSYRRIGDYENALRHFDMAAARQPGKSYYLERCEIYVVRRNLSLAVQALRSSDHIQVDVTRMIEFVRQLQEAEGKAPFFREATAVFHLAGGDPDEARLQYLHLHERDTGNPRYVRQLLQIARTTADETGIGRWLKALVAVDLRDVNARRELGEQAAKAGDWDGAIELLRAAQDIQPLEATARILNEVEHELEQAEAQAEIALLIERPRTAAGDLRMGELYLVLSRTDVARRLLEPLLEEPEHGVHVTRLLGLSAHGESNWAEAVRFLRLYLSRRTNLAPDELEIEARWALGLSHEGLGQHELAAVQYHAIYEADRTFAEVAIKLRNPKFQGRSMPGATQELDLNPESSAVRELDALELGDPDDDSEL